jgi:secondary thiamine-phosphate synthase enzyme
MNVIEKDILIKTKGEMDIIDITQQLEKIVNNSTISSGIICVFVGGSTGALTTLEYEPGLQHDIPIALERIAPKNSYYAHHETWHDDNGHSHVRASLIGPSITLPIRNKKIIHGTWQQVVFIELDTQPRTRTLYLQILGK